MSKENMVNKVINHMDKNLNPEYFITPNGKCMMTLNIHEQRKTVFVDSQACVSLIYSISAEVSSDLLTDNCKKTIKAHLLAKCYKSKLKKDYVVRVHAKNDFKNTANSVVTVDLCDAENSTVEIDKNGFKILKGKELPFLQPSRQTTMPQPIEVGLDSFVKDFKSLFNLKNTDEYLLILAFILKCYWRDFGDYVHLNFAAEKGTGKSTATEVIKKLIDPTNPELISPPEKDEGISALAANRFLIGIDNVSHINSIMADTYCRMSTGGSNSKRSNYTDNDENTVDIKRPIIFNGIDELTNRSDLLDRIVTLRLVKMDFGKRIGKADYWEDFNSKYPLLLGGIYKLLSECIRIFSTIKVVDLPRMTEFAIIGTAIEVTLDLPKDTFIKVYKQNQKTQIEDAFYTDDICMAVDGLLSDNQKYAEKYFNELAKEQNKPYHEIQLEKNDFGAIELSAKRKYLKPVLIGTTAQIRNYLENYSIEDSKQRKRFKLPSDLSSLSKAINRRRSTFENHGIVVMDFERSAKERIKIIGYKADVERYLDIVSKLRPEYDNALDAL